MKIVHYLTYLFFSFTVLMFLNSCQEHYTPKSKGYVKVKYPEKHYTVFDTTAPFKFEYPVYARVIPDKSPNAEPHWYNIKYPDFDATIYLSYKEVQNNLQTYIEDSRELAYKHSIKAEAIDESLIRDTSREVFGIIYDLRGNTASSVQFFTTDSTEHFLRGSLYFNTKPNRDSLRPVIQFIRKDIIHLIETLSWE